MLNAESRPVVVIGIPESRRVALLQAALAELGRGPAQVISYAGLLDGTERLEQVVSEGAIVRIESPGKDFAVERALLARGAAPLAESGADHLDRDQIEGLAFEKGLIVYPRQWYLGFCAALDMVAEQLATCPPHRLMSSPWEIALMFDKPRCHELMLSAGVPVPPALGPVDSFDALLERMRELGWGRVFVKLAHGSSASGVVAYQTSGGRHQATTTVELVQAEGRLRLYNSRRMRVYRDLGEIRALIDELCRHHVHVERWIPKASLDGRVFDLRVVVIAGRARHVVVRLSRSPITNLHLLNGRSGPEPLIARMGEERWRAALRSCEQAAALFPASHYTGLDLLVAPGYRHHAILEANAFGDLLPGALHEGQSTYAAELTEFLVPGYPLAGA